jgi:hypothetical protein
MSDDIIAKVQAGKSGDWRLESEIIKALGGIEKLQSGVTISGAFRTPGRQMVQWPGRNHLCRMPYFLRNDESKASAIRQLRKKIKEPKP